MDKNVLTKVNFILSAQNIRPFDILLALGKKDIVPDDIEKDRLDRVLKRDGKESSEGYIRNAIEDLNNLNFANKVQVIDLLKSQLKGLGGLGQVEKSTWKLYAILVLIVISIYVIFRKRQQLQVLLIGPKKLRNRRKK